MELAERMRLENHEQFQTLVRMHLSFELDLHTDDNDATPLNDGKPETAGGKFRKRFHFNKKPKVVPPPKMTGSPVLSPACIGQMRQLMEFLMKEHNVIQEGIFRRTGSVARQTELKARVVCGDAAAIAAAASSVPLPLDNGTYTVHDCASVLKGVLADLPEPLLTDAYAPAHMQMAELCNNLIDDANNSCGSSSSTAAGASSSSTSSAKATRLLHALQLLILLLPIENRHLLQEIITMLHHTMLHEPSNKMSADSLATLFTPHLICPKKLTPEALHATAANLSGIISFMITRGAAIFECPPKLATDIRAYFAEQRRKQTLSPEQILDESVTSDSTANTVYTFVDRERTAQAHDQNPTDTCLAQLYAYIQGLPESSKKRKLIKQFNKENGQGTPLQVQKLHRLKMVSGGGGEGCSGAGSVGGSAAKASGAGKSLGDSIKRHIFQKNLLARTPKQPSSTLGPMLLPHSVAAFATPSTTAALAAARSGKSSGFDTPTNRATPHQSKPPSQLSQQQPQLNARVLFQSPASINTPPSRGVTPATASASTSTSSASHLSKVPVAQQTATISQTNRKSPRTAMNTTSSSRSSSTTDESGDPLESSEFELLSETIGQLQQSFPASENSSKTTVAVHNNPIVDRENRHAALKTSRYRSEPNLTKILGDHNGPDVVDGETVAAAVSAMTETTATTAMGTTHRRQSGGRYIANKLLKGVSMVNLMLPSLASTSKVSSELPTTAKIPIIACTPPKQRQPTTANETEEHTTTAGSEMLRIEEDEDIDDPDFVATPQSQRSLNNHSRRFSADGDYADIVTPTTRSTGSAHASLLLSHQQQHLQHILMSGRRSMSPITKSTQRMSKAMQESIMTPRSRKPVMLTGALLGCGLTASSADANAAASQATDTNSTENTAFGSFREQDEDELFDLSKTPAALYKSKSEGDFSVLLGNGQQQQHTAFFGTDDENEYLAGSLDPPAVRLSLGSAASAAAAAAAAESAATAANACLSNQFKNYLLSRSAVSDSPVDSSFSSQPDDFGSTPDMRTLEGTEPTDLSDSLLYCLDGNRPASATAASVPLICGLQRTASNSSRKRTNGGAEDGSADAAEERQYFDELHPKKVTVTSGISNDSNETDGPGETSL